MCLFNIHNQSVRWVDFRWIGYRRWVPGYLRGARATPVGRGKPLPQDEGVSAASRSSPVEHCRLPTRQAVPEVLRGFRGRDGLWPAPVPGAAPEQGPYEVVE